MLALLAVLLVAGHAAASPPQLLDVKVTNGSTPFFRDGRYLTTVSPNGDGFRDAAHVQFRLTAGARVRLDVVQADTQHGETATTTTLQTLRRSLGPGEGELVWRPAPST